jgi:HEAT repeat protein
MSDPEDSLKARLADRDPYVRVEAASQLAQIASAAGREALVQAQGSKDPLVRSRAAFVMGQIGGAWVIEPLGRLLADKAPSVRNEAIFALMRTHRPDAVPLLIAALDDVDPDRREDARVALVTLLGDEIASVLARMEEDVPDESQQALDWWNDNAARFDPDTVYEHGQPVSIERWIEELASAPPELVDLKLDRLATWTGEDFGASASKWRAWWKKNAARFPAGKRFYWGHPV